MSPGGVDCIGEPGRHDLDGCMRFKWVRYPVRGHVAWQMLVSALMLGETRDFIIILNIEVEM